MEPGYGLHDVSPGCKHCYARTMAERLKAMAVPGYETALTLPCNRIACQNHYTAADRPFTLSIR